MKNPTYKAELCCYDTSNKFGYVCITNKHGGLAGWAKWNGFNIFDPDVILSDEDLANLDEQCAKQAKQQEEEEKNKYY